MSERATDKALSAPLVDIGANLTNLDFAKDLNGVLHRARASGVKAIIVTGTSVESSWSAHQLTSIHPGFLYATAGVHPHAASTWTGETRVEIGRLLRSPGVVAVGECGLDYARDLSPRAQQALAFEEQLSLAAAVALPVFMHEREAHDAFVALLRPWRPLLTRAVVHCFTGSRQELRAYLDLDLHVGITGWITDPRRGSELRDAVRYIPLSRLMVETDAPYLLPSGVPGEAGVRVRGRRRNEPAFLPYVVRALAASSRLDAETIAKQTTETARAFFGLPALAL